MSTHVIFHRGADVRRGGGGGGGGGGGKCPAPENIYQSCTNIEGAHFQNVRHR